ncbi:glycoside hydrolase family 43 protein [Flagellimonas sp. S174]|uniref:glycoside hydrolase family 43 protein n=1 Tax=Flagellimonas sp. S174 TaxID=3410790 RepID=UPI003BF4AC15
MTRSIMTLYKGFLLIILLLIYADINAQQAAKTGNPILEDWYADPEMVILGNTYWLFPTSSGISSDRIALDAFSSNDLVSWKKHEAIISSKNVDWIDDSLWAPSAIEKDGKYFVFFSANDIQTPESKWWNPKKHDSTEVGGIGVAVAKNPRGPYKDLLGKPLIGKVHNKAQPIDQFVFKDIDGTYYMIYGGWNHCNIAKLNTDFTGFIAFENGQYFKEITPKDYVEGPFMFVKNDKYYFMWSEGSWGKDNYSVAYAIADSPLGPFERLDTVLQSDPQIATGAGHHSILNIPNTDDWYMIYHRRPIPNEHRNHRVVCIDKMEFNTDGTIKPIKMTFEGVGTVPLNSAKKK